jgi:hypothetical protein
MRPFAAVGVPSDAQVKRGSFSRRKYFSLAVNYNAVCKFFGISGVLFRRPQEMTVQKTFGQ